MVVATRAMDRRRMIRLPGELDEGLMTLARQHGTTVSALVRQAVIKEFFLPMRVQSGVSERHWIARRDVVVEAAADPASE